MQSKKLHTLNNNQDNWNLKSLQSLQLYLDVMDFNYISNQKRIKPVLPEACSVQNIQIHEWDFGLFP